MPATEARAAVRRPTAIAIASSSSSRSGGIAVPARSRYPPAGPVRDSTGYPSARRRPTSRRTVRPETSSRSASSAPGQSRRAWSSDSRSSSRLEVSLIRFPGSPRLRTDPDLNTLIACGASTTKGASMSGQDRYIPGVPCWIDTTQPDPAAAAEFYGDLFGWELEDVMPADSPVKYYIGRRDGGDVAAVSSRPEGAPEGAVWNTYVWVDDADATSAKVREARRHGRAPSRSTCSTRGGWPSSPTRRARSSRSGRRRSTAAPRSSTSTARSTSTSSAPRDLDAAAAFYGAVFGWEVIDAGGAPMWALPGYGDFLESRTPGMRENMAAMGAPERFEDVVASVTVDADDPAALGRDLRRRRRRRDRRAHEGAGRRGARPAVRRALGADGDRPRPAGGRRSRRASSCPRTRTSEREPRRRPEGAG